MPDYQPLHRYEHFKVSRFCAILQRIMESADRITGNDKIIKSAINSLLGRAELCTQENGSHCE
jgi:hypothetical protein